jgi:hypothetical protein
MTATKEIARIQNKIAGTPKLALAAVDLRRDTAAELFFDIIVIRTYSPLKIPNHTIASLTHRRLLVEQVFSENLF